MPKITQRQALSLPHLTCMMCGAERATVQLRIEKNGSALVLQPCLGEKCAEKSTGKIYQYFMNHKPK